MKQAQDGIDKMREHVDTILIISNDKLRQQFGNLPFTQAFAKADDILATAAKCITDVITTTGQINVDFADVCTVMKNGGVAILGSASATGENRAVIAVEEALNSPLLNDSDISGAKWLLLNITSAAGEFEHTMDEAEAIQAYVQQQAGDNCDVILGMGHDPNLKEKIAVTVIATGFNHKDIKIDFPAKNNEPEKIVVKLVDMQPAAEVHAEVRAAVKQTEYTMTPVLVEMPIVNYSTDYKPTETYMPAQTDNYMQLVEDKQEVVEEKAPVFMQEEKRPDEIPMQLLIKNEEPAKESVIMKIGDRILSEDEIEEKRRFEEQKRALEDRAERLRRMSFNIKGTESNDEMESVPAYMRKNMKLDNQTGSSDSFYSGYTVGMNDQQNQQAGIQTINTFLDGKKPD